MTSCPARIQTADNNGGVGRAESDLESMPMTSTFVPYWKEQTAA